MANVKVLFSGAAMGKVEGMMKKAEAANKKVGADALFCVGQFFGEVIACLSMRVGTYCRAAAVLQDCKHTQP